MEANVRRRSCGLAWIPAVQRNASAGKPNVLAFRFVGTKTTKHKKTGDGVSGFGL